MESVAADYCIDLGTRKLAVSHRDRGIIHVGPSVIALAGGDSPVPRSTGEEALEKASLRSTKVDAEWPIGRGGVRDTQLCGEMLRRILGKARSNPLRGMDTVAVGVPGNQTRLQRRAVIHALMTAGAKRVTCVPGILAAAYGMGMDLSGTSGVLIADVGAGHTDVAVLAYDGIVKEESIPFGGLDAYSHACRMIAREFGVMVPVNTLDVHRDAVFNRRSRVRLAGMDLSTCLPTVLEIDCGILASFLEEKAHIIRDSIRRVLEESGPEISSDVAGTGIVLTGGFSPLPGLRESLLDSMGFPVLTCESPELCVINGLHRLTSRTSNGFMGLEGFIKRRLGRAV